VTKESVSKFVPHQETYAVTQVYVVENKALATFQEEPQQQEEDSFKPPTQPKPCLP